MDSSRTEDFYFTLHCICLHKSWEIFFRFVRLSFFCSLIPAELETNEFLHVKLENICYPCTGALYDLVRGGRSGKGCCNIPKVCLPTLEVLCAPHKRFYGVFKYKNVQCMFIVHRVYTM